MRIVFMGTPDFAVPSLERLVKAGYAPVAVVTGPDRPRGRGQEVTPTAVKRAAERLGIGTILQPESVRDPAFAKALHELEPDLIVVVAFRILPPEVFRAARRGAFNLHGSLLPKYRGAAPINHAVMQGESETGVTTFFLEEEVDTGSVILQESMHIGPNETAGEVHDRMKDLGAEAVVETVRLIERAEAEARPQRDDAATPAPKIRREDCRIRWDRPALQVHNQIRGLSPYPGAWTRHGDALLKIHRSSVFRGGGAAARGRDSAAPGTDGTAASGKNSAAPSTKAAAESRTGPAGSDDDPDSSVRAEAVPGEVVDADGRLLVACGEGAVELLELQQEGRKRLEVDAFLHGYSLTRGDRLNG